MCAKGAREIARAISRGETSATEVVTRFLSRIEKTNPHHRAVVQLFGEQALEAARRADASPMQGRGPLHGVPFSAKDVFEVAGEISSAGLEERRDFRPRATAVAVARLQAAGAILLGKTNCPPGGGGGESDNPVYGRTNNPYDLGRTPGGSSGGEAALIASGGSPLGLGSDSGGSLRLPAHYCGIFSFKPSTGRIPNTGTVNHPGGLVDPRTQIGPMGTRVEDLELAFSLLCGPDFRDSGVLVPEPYHCLSSRDTLNPSTLRVGYFDSDGHSPPEDAIRTSVREVVETLSRAGAKVTSCLPYSPEVSLSVSTRYWEGCELDGGEYNRLLEDWNGFRTGLLSHFQDYDLFVGPTSATTAPPHGGVSVESFSYTLPYSLLGNPCLTFPIGTDARGLPMAVQLAAAPWNEGLLFRVGYFLERALSPRERIPEPELTARA